MQTCQQIRIRGTRDMVVIRVPWTIIRCIIQVASLSHNFRSLKDKKSLLLQRILLTLGIPECLLREIFKVVTKNRRPPTSSSLINGDRAGKEGKQILILHLRCSRQTWKAAGILWSSMDYSWATRFRKLIRPSSWEARGLTLAILWITLRTPRATRLSRMALQLEGLPVIPARAWGKIAWGQALARKTYRSRSVCTLLMSLLRMPSWRLINKGIANRWVT